MKSKSIIEKGKRLEKFLCQEIEAMGLGVSVRTPGSGNGLHKGDIFNNLKFLFECKNEKQVNILKNIDQAKNQAEKGNKWPEKWALISRDPRYPEFEKVYATIDLWQFLELLKRNEEPMIKEPDRQTSWHIKSAISALKLLEKDFNN
jgi:hypothetical protein